MVAFEEVGDVTTGHDTGRIALLEGGVDEGRDVAAEVTDHLHVDAIGDDELQEGVSQEGACDRKRNRADARNLTDLAVFELSSAKGRQVDAHYGRMGPAPTAGTGA